MSAFLNKARTAAKKKNHDYAITMYLEHLKVDPTDVEARKELRQVEREKHRVSPLGWSGKVKARATIAKVQAFPLSKKDPEGAMMVCENALQYDPNCIPVLIKLGQSAVLAEHFEVAIAVLEDAMMLEKTNKEVHRNLGRAHKARGDYEKATKHFEILAKLEPTDAEAINEVRDLGAKISSKKIQERGSEGYRGLIDEEAAAKLEKQSQRVRTAEQALERVEDIREELDKNPGDEKLMRLMAQMYLKAKQFGDAIEILEKANDLKPGDYLTTELMGDVRIAQFDDTLKKLEAAYRKNPEETIKRKYVKAKQERLLFLIEEYHRRAEAHPTELGHRFRLGKAFFDAGRLDEAIAELQKAKGDARCKTEAGYYLGRCFYSKKSLRLAVKELQSARDGLFEMEGINKDITYLLGRIFEAAKKNEQALEEYERIAEADYGYRDVTQRIENLSQF